MALITFRGVLEGTVSVLALLTTIGSLSMIACLFVGRFMSVGRGGPRLPEDDE